MYLTAQRVRSTLGRTGINAFLYLHKDHSVPGMKWESPNLPRVADAQIGERVAEIVDVAPGGNRVVSYLDIVAADDTSPDVIDASLREFAANLNADELPYSLTVGRVALRFGAQFGLGYGAHDELRQVAKQAQTLLRNRAQPAWLQAEPLDIDITRHGGGTTYWLQQHSADRLRQIHGKEWRPPKVFITDDNHHDFEKLRADFIPHLLSMLTDLELERIAELGGGRLLNADAGGKVVLVWPAR